LVRQLVERGRRVLVVDCFAAPGSSGRAELVHREQESRFFQTYNRTVAMERIQDILTAIAYLRHAAGADAVDLLGFKAAGIWCLLARAVAGATASTVVDVDDFDPDDDRQWMENAFIPLIRRAGGLDTALALAAPAKLCIHNARDRFPAGRVSKLYQALSKPEHLRIEQGGLSEEEIVRWITGSD
jgi:dienelactone hydrolase